MQSKIREEREKINTLLRDVMKDIVVTPEDIARINSELDGKNIIDKCDCYRKLCKSLQCLAYIYIPNPCQNLSLKTCKNCIVTEEVAKVLQNEDIDYSFYLASEKIINRLKGYFFFFYNDGEFFNEDEANI